VWRGLKFLPCTLADIDGGLSQADLASNGPDPVHTDNAYKLMVFEIQKKKSREENKINFFNRHTEILLCILCQSPSKSLENVLPEPLCPQEIKTSLPITNTN
jgi:hypothetical protein